MSLETEFQSDFDRIIKDLQQEAQISVELIRELAGLEGYIAETYAQRCLAELFQNSDDSQSSEVAILRQGDYLVYANNGQSFSENDFRSLCKSASSLKKRGKSIGYRGIGFKSVVNICSNVMIASGPLKCCFDKDRTAKLLDCTSGVPLIRVPHRLTLTENNLCEKVMQELPAYSTFFIFRGLNEDSIDQEFSGLSPEHFLFLRNLGEISISLSEKKSLVKYGIQRSKASQAAQKELVMTNIAITSGVQELPHLWSVATMDNVSLAVKSVDDIPSRVLKQESLLHAYLPTQAISCLGARVNADFSTDPSRTRLKYDSQTDKAIQKVASLASALIENYCQSRDSLFLRGFVDALIPYSEYKILELQGNKFCSELLNFLKSNLLTRSDSKYSLHQLPDAYKDIESVGSRLPNSLNVFLPISASYSDTRRFLEIIGAKPLSLEKVIEFHSARENAMDAHVCHIFLRNLVNESADTEDLKKVYSLVGADGEVVSAIDIVKQNIALDNRFLSNLVEAFHSHRRVQEFLELLGLSSSHIGNSFGKTAKGIDVDSLVKRTKISDKVDNSAVVTSSANKIQVLDEESKRRYGIQNWRLSEEVVAYYYRSQGYKVIDVSQANKGYDLEVIGDSKRLCVEVKDIKDTIKGFSLTQNEYTEADILGSEYVLALVRRSQDDALDIMFIADPGKSLQAFTTKRARAYEFLITGFKYSPDVSFK